MRCHWGLQGHILKGATCTYSKNIYYIITSNMEKNLVRLILRIKYLQDPKMNLHKAVMLSNSYKKYISKLKNDLKLVEEESSIFLKTTSYKSGVKRAHTHTRIL